MLIERNSKISESVKKSHLALDGSHNSKGLMPTKTISKARDQVNVSTLRYEGDRNYKK